MSPTPAEFDGHGPDSLPQCTRSSHPENIFSFDQFQIALPPNRFGIMLRPNWPLTRWAASYPEREEPP